MAHIYPSLIAADPLHLYETIKQLEPYCAGFHCDVMDNHFTPNLTFGIATVNAINEASYKPSWVHLMVYNPIKLLKKLILKEDSIVSFHIESTNNIQSLCEHIRENNWKPSIAINPKTSIETSFPYLHLIDQILIMSVEPGFSGQRFLDKTLIKAPALIQQRKNKNLSFAIGIDGGITTRNIHTIVQNGITDIATASAIFNTSDPIDSLKQLSKIT